eukprot:Sspe_Gene.112113::Locus_94661_Transcript_1_1_Confidence_1.000_Length_1373::g.112113::m.112113
MCRLCRYSGWADKPALRQHSIDYLRHHRVRCGVLCNHLRLLTHLAPTKHHSPLPQCTSHLVLVAPSLHRSPPPVPAQHNPHRQELHRQQLKVRCLPCGGQTHPALLLLLLFLILHPYKDIREGVAPQVHDVVLRSQSTKINFGHLHVVPRVVLLCLRGGRAEEAGLIPLWSTVVVQQPHGDHTLVREIGHNMCDGDQRPQHVTEASGHLLLGVRFFGGVLRGGDRSTTSLRVRHPEVVGLNDILILPCSVQHHQRHHMEVPLGQGLEYPLFKPLQEKARVVRVGGEDLDGQSADGFAGEGFVGEEGPCVAHSRHPSADHVFGEGKAFDRSDLLGTPLLLRHCIGKWMESTIPNEVQRLL